MRYDVSLTNFEDGTSRAHLIRYYFARGFVRQFDRVVDAACGTGYGSKMLSEVAGTVYAYDQVEGTRHPALNVVYQKVDLETFTDYPEAEIGVSLETIEHLSHDGAKHFLSQLLPKLKRFFIFSVPMGEESGVNPFHKQVFNPNTLESLMTFDGWKPFHSLQQGNHFLGVLWKV